MRVGMLELRRLVTVMLAAATAAACSGDDDGGTEPAPTIDIALSSPTLSVPQGASGTVTVTLTRTGGFTGDVAIAVDGLPTGVTMAAAPQTLGTSAASSVITITAGATATPAVTNLTVRASGAGVTAKTASLALTVTAAPAQGYTLAVAPATSTVPQGGNVTVNVTLTRTGGFAGAVGLAVTGLPTGVTPVFNPQSIPGTSSTATITLTAAANAAVGGPTTVTVTSTATGQTDKTATFQLTVTAAPASGFTLSLAPTTVSVQQGGTATSTVTISRTSGFAGAVTLTATGLPNGVTAAFDPAAPTTNTSTLTLTAAANAPVGGPTTVTVRGNATGNTEQTAALAVNVTAVTGGSGNTTWEFCTVAETPLWMAIQDGSGTWTRVTPTGTKFQFNITQAKAAVAFVSSTTSASVTSSGFARRTSSELHQAMLLRNRRVTRASAYASNALVDGFGLSIYYGTQAELNAQGTGRCLPGAGKTVNGTVAGLGANQSATITLGTASTTVENPATTFSLTNVPDGALDLVAARRTTTVSQTGVSSVLDRIIILRGRNQANGSSVGLDFDGPDAFAPAIANIAIGNLGGDVAFAATSFFTAAGGSADGASLLDDFSFGTGPFVYYGVPLAKQVAGDLHEAVAIAFPLSGDQQRFAGIYFKDPTDRTVTLGAALSAPTVSVAATAPYLRVRFTGPIQVEYNRFVNASLAQSSGAVARNVDIFASEGYLAGLDSYDFTIPDFTGVSGWDNNWGLKAGVETDWFVRATGYTGTGFMSARPVEGSTFQAAARLGTITP